MSEIFVLCKGDMYLLVRLAVQSGIPIWRNNLSTTQTAEKLGLCDECIRQRIEAGVIPARRIGRNYQVPRIVVEYFCSEFVLN